MSLLGSHQAIRHSGEIIGESRLRWNPIGAEISALGLERYVNDSFRRKGRERITGVKVLHYQFEDGYGNRWGVPRLSRVRDMFVEDSELPIIHLKRRNLLSTLVSGRMAGVTSQYLEVDVRRRKNVQVELTPEECIKHFEATRRWERQYDDLFQQHPIIEIFYEDLAENTESTTNRALDFLAVDRRKLQTDLIRQRTTPLSETITNFNQLREQFSGTEWEHFFLD